MAEKEKLVTFTLRIPQSLAQQIEQKAKEKMMSRSDIIRQIIIASLKKKK